MIETIPYTTDAAWLQARQQDVTSTEVSALFGCNPRLTEYELYYRKREGVAVEFEPSERVLWGTRLQEAIARGIAEDHLWDIRPMTEYLRDPDLRMGASFDYAVGDDAILEVKNVDALVYRDGWLIDDEGDLEAPLHMEFQAQQQLALSGRSKLYLGALIGGNRIAFATRLPDPKAIAAIKAKIAAFWKAVDGGTPPTPDYARDAEFIARLYNYAEPGKLKDARGDEAVAVLMAHYRAAQQAEKEAGTRKDAAKAELLTLIGDAEKVLGDGWTISAGVVAEAEISYTRKPYRMFKPSYKKETK